MAYTLYPLVEINGLDCTNNLTTYEINKYDLSSAESGDKQDGDSVYEIVGKDKFQLTLEWTCINDDYKNLILSKIAQGTDIPVRFSYASIGLDDGGLCYRGDRNLDLVTPPDGTGERLWNLKFNLIGLYVGR